MPRVPSGSRDVAKVRHISNQPCLRLTGYSRWESGQFHLGQFQDDCFKALPPDDKKSRYASSAA